jgi:hypothetical protein
MGNIGIAEIALVLAVGVVSLAALVGLVALGTRLGTRHLRQER